MNAVSWTGIAPLLISLGSLVVAAGGFWRSGRVRVLDLRLTVRKDIAVLRIDLEGLPQKIAQGMTSRVNVLSAMGMGGSGAAQAFHDAGDADLETLKRLQAQLSKVDRFWLLARWYGAVERKAVSVHAIRHDVNLLQAKYAKAMSEDDENRDRIRKEKIDHVNWVIRQGRSGDQQG
jgi:hypothetical protein